MKTLTEIYTDVLNELKLQFSISSPGLTLQVFSQVHALSLYLYLKEQGEVQKNFTPETAYSESLGGTLEAFGRRVLGRNPNPATQGEYVLNISGSVGGIVEAGTQLRDSDNNLFEVQDTVTLTSTTGLIDVISNDAGTDFELAVNASLFFTIPIADINSEATVVSIVTEPIDEESIDDYKSAIVKAELIEAEGGSAADYRIWALDANGVVNAYAYVTSNPGEINLYVEANTDDGVPTETILEEVEEVVEFNPDTTLENRGRRPLSAWIVNYLSVIPVNVDIDIVNLSDDSQSVIDTITSAVKSYLEEIRPKVDGADDPNKKNDILSLGNINSVVDSALDVGNTYDNIVLKVASSSVSTFQFLGGNIPFLNSVNAI